MSNKTIFALAKRAIPLVALLGSNADAASGWGQSMTIVSYIPTETDLTIVVTANSANPMGCTAATWLRMNTSDPNYALASSALLTAFTQGKAVKVWQDTCESDGSVHFVGAWIDY